MPSASANISAKFIAQIEMSSNWVARYSDPAEATRPRIVSISGSPAATSEPKASTRITIVTGQLNSSDLIIAVRLAVLKSDHMPLAPVSETCTPSPWRRCSCVLRSSAARTMVLASAAAPACTIAVWPSREIDAPGCGATDGLHAPIGLQHALRRGDRSLEGRVLDRLVAASARRPSGRWRTGPGSSWSIALRAATDSEPVASQPAPDSAVSTLGAKTPSATATSAQAIATVRKWVAV